MLLQIPNNGRTVECASHYATADPQQLSVLATVLLQIPSSGMTSFPQPVLLWGSPSFIKRVTEYFKNVLDVVWGEVGS